jgi:hypothetical protein
MDLQHEVAHLGVGDGFADANASALEAMPKMYF